MRGSGGFPKDGPMTSVLWLAAFLVFWILLQVWILPRLGVST
jgi:hypothetical protein